MKNYHIYVQKDCFYVQFGLSGKMAPMKVNNCYVGNPPGNVETMATNEFQLKEEKFQNCTHQKI